MNDIELNGGYPLSGRREKDDCERSSEAISENRLFYDGDHFQNGKGLMTRPTNDSDLLAKRRETFVFENIIKETVDRKRDGVLGREPNWRVVRRDGKELSESENALIAEFTSAFIRWWNDRDLLTTIKDQCVEALLTGRGVLRPYAPEGFRNESGKIVEQNNLSAALDLLHFEVVKDEKSGVFRDKKTLRSYSVFRTVRDNQNYVDFSFVDADGVTHFKTFTDSGFIDFANEFFPTSLAKYITEPTGTKQTGESSMDLGGKLHLFEMSFGAPFVTGAIKSLQKKHNLDLTMEGRNSYTAGFRERHFLNADLPEDGTFATGAGATSFTQGVPIYETEEKGGKIIGKTTPSLTVIEPVDPTTFHQSQSSNYAKILSQAEQRHVLISDQASASGVSRVEARAEFRTSLLNIKQPTDGSIRYVVEFAMAFAAALTGRESEFAAYRVDADCIISAGVPSPEEKEANRKAYEAGEIDLETLMSWNGVEDSDAMMKKIQSAPDYELNKALDAFEKAATPMPASMIIELLTDDETLKARLIKHLPQTEVV